jgi:hypothetical protein
MTANPLQLPLRDIHLPESVSWWPPAPGWWILFGLFILLPVGIGWLYRRRSQYLKSTAYQAKIQLQLLREDYSNQGNSLKLVRELSALLRRICLSVYPRSESASLTGREWLALLDQSVSGEPFLKGSGRVLVEAPYQRNPDIEVDSLLSLCQEWIESVTRDGRKLQR